MPIDTSMYPISQNNALLRSTPMDKLYAPPTAKDIIDLAEKRTSLESAKIRNRLEIMGISDKESERKAEVDRQNYLLGIGGPPPAKGGPPVTQPGGQPTPALPSPPRMPVPNQNALSAGIEGAPGGSVQPTAPVESPAPAPTMEPPAPTEPTAPVDPLTQVKNFLEGTDLPQPRNYGEFTAKQQLLAQRRQQFDDGHKRTMTEFKPIYDSIIVSGDDEAMKSLLKAASKNPYLAGMASYLKDIKLTGPGKTEMTSAFNQAQLDHLKTIAATPILSDVIANAPPGNYKVKTEHGKVTTFDSAYSEKSLTAEQLAQRAVQEEKTAKGDTTPVTANEIIKKMAEVKGEGKTAKTEYEQTKAVLKEVAAVKYLTSHGQASATPEEIQAVIKKGLIPEPTEMDIERHMHERKKDVAKAQASGRIEGTFGNEYMTDLVGKIAKNLIAGKTAPSEVRNTFGVPLHDLAVAKAVEMDTNYNAIEADSNYKWYSSQSTQRLIRRTESIVSKDGAIAEAIRLSKQLEQPAGTPINKLVGKVGIAFGNSRRQVFELANSILAEEGGQIFGAMGGGVRFLELAQSLTSPDLSVEQFINAAKEMRYMIYTRQMTNVRGTPQQKVYEEAFEEIKRTRPFLTDKEKKEGKEGKGKRALISRDEWINKAKQLNPGLSLDAIQKEYEKKYGKGGP